MTEIRYTWWDRFVFRMTGRWPQRVVNARLDALIDDEVARRKERREYEAYAARHYND